jgi:hypothetical protein
VSLTSSPSFENDSAESMLLSGVRAGTIIKVFDDSRMRRNDDFVEILVKSNGQTLCVPTFEATSSDANLQMVFTSVGANLDNEVSSIEVTSAMIANNGVPGATVAPTQMCADVNTNDRFVQIFPCHMGANQSWTYVVDGTIRGWNGLCLEANPSDVNAWPSLGAGVTRTARVQVGTCGGPFQKWSVSNATSTIRMFGNMCLDIRGGGSAPNTAVQLFPCHGGSNQLWLSSF